MVVISEERGQYFKAGMNEFIFKILFTILPEREHKQEEREKQAPCLIPGP